MIEEKLLIAEDEESLRLALTRLFEANGFQVVQAADGKEALAALPDPKLGVALVDVKLPGVDGLEVLGKAREINPDLRVIVMTAHSSMQTAVEAMKLGAFDFLAKPFPMEELEEVVARAMSARSMYRELAALREEVKEHFQQAEQLVGQSRPMLELYKAIGKISQTDATVLLLGESGTGKELVARTVHANSLRFARPFKALNLTAIPRDIMEAELFGFERGSFTGAVEAKRGKLAEAEGGTLLLDEIGDMPVELQAKLLRVIEQREYEPLGASRSRRLNIRFIAATNQDLKAKVAAGQFRPDLYYRLNVITLRLPPLRERKEDIPLLVKHFCQKYEPEAAKGPKMVSPQAMRLLLEHSWPGNVRELENAIHRALILAAGPALLPEDLSLAMTGKYPSLREGETSLEKLVEAKLAEVLHRLGSVSVHDLYRLVMEMVERPLLRLVLEKTKGNKVKAAAMLGLNRNTLAKKLVAQGLAPSLLKKEEE